LFRNQRLVILQPILILCNMMFYVTGAVLVIKVYVKLYPEMCVPWRYIFISLLRETKIQIFNTKLQKSFSVQQYSKLKYWKYNIQVIDSTHWPAKQCSP
jgi:hypothetical protein